MRSIAAKWIVEHGRSVFHRSADPDGMRALCGIHIPGAPVVYREGEVLPGHVQFCHWCRMAWEVSR